MTDLTIYGQTVHLNDLDDGEIVTDVIVLSRVCVPTEDGINDYIRHAGSTNTTQLIKTGMFNAAVAADNSTWTRNSPDEDDQ